MLQAVYNWMMDRASHRHALVWLAAISFVESSFFPIPPDIMLIPMVLAAPTRWFRLALVCTIASVIGGYFGYAIGHFLMEPVGMPILRFFHIDGKLPEFKAFVDHWGMAGIIIKGATPIPYKLVTIAAGAFDFDLAKFTIASIIARGMRFFLIAALLWKFGEPIRDFVEKRLKLVMTAAVVLLVGGFAALKLL
ncbi:MAG TPA: YqaA family protein [Magnetospirillum sp.]|jgi:membrane protein YqaA with SNARE-associated domain|nr:YqaA family protein [Magnetospirillum sp.]